MGRDEMRTNSMMAHLLEALEAGNSVGHYGRLVMAMVGRHFLEEDELVALLARDPECDDEQARSLVRQVNARDYNPPRRERILEWMQLQDFPICPGAQDPRACNVYRDLHFPREIYEKIERFYENANA